MISDDRVGALGTCTARNAQARNASSPADVSPTSFKALRCCCCCCLLVLLPSLHSGSSIHYGCLNLLLIFLSYDCGLLPQLLAGAQQCNLQNRLTAHTYIQTLSLSLFGHLFPASQLMNKTTDSRQPSPELERAFRGGCNESGSIRGRNERNCT
jgi:hypothetical protein